MTWGNCGVLGAGGAGGAGGDHGPRAGAGADTGMLGGPAIAALALAAGIAAIRRRLG